MSKFEQQYESITREYDQINESTGKKIKNWFKHPTGKGKGEEIVKTFQAFCKKYHFNPQQNDADLYAKVIDKQMIGIKLDFEDDVKSGEGTVLYIIKNKKDKKTGSLAISHADTIQEFAANLQAKLKEDGFEGDLSQMDLDDENQSQKSKGQEQPQKSKDQQLAEKIFSDRDVKDDQVEDYAKVFLDLWGKLDDNQKVVIKTLIK